MNDAVHTQTVDRVRVLRLHRPDRLNAVNVELYEKLSRCVADAVEDETVRALVLTGTGRGFCVGADLKAHGEAPPDGATRKRYVTAAQAANWALQQCAKPIVAAVQGHAVGAGLELALSCDLIVVAERAKLRLPELGLGTFLGGGVTYTLPARVGMTRAREIILRGPFFRGTEAAAWGLANRAVPADEVLDTALEWARDLAGKSARSMRHARRLLVAHSMAWRKARLEEEAEALLDCMGTADWVEGLAAFADRRDPDFFEP